MLVHTFVFVFLTNSKFLLLPLCFSCAFEEAQESVNRSANGSFAITLDVAIQSLKEMGNRTSEFYLDRVE